jgi:hypothetical protein
MIIVIAAIGAPPESCVMKEQTGTTDQLEDQQRIHLRASDSLGRKEPQRHRDGNLSDLDSRRGHRHLAVRAATGQYSASWTERRRVRRLRRPSDTTSSATSGSQRIEKSSRLAETW